MRMANSEYEGEVPEKYAYVRRHAELGLVPQACFEPLAHARSERPMEVAFAYTVRHISYDLLHGSYVGLSGDGSVTVVVIARRMMPVN